MKRQLFTILVTSFLILIIFAEAFSIIPNFIVHAYGSNWLAGWNYRQQLTWTNATDMPLAGGYQLNFTIYNAKGTSSGYNCYANGHVLKSDFSDVRVTANDGQTLLSEWEQSYTSGVSATIWFNDTDSWAGSTSTVYVYYGNSGASVAFNGWTTFVLYDDFNNGATINSTIWDTSGTVSQSDGILTVNSNMSDIYSINTYGTGYAFMDYASRGGTAYGPEVNSFLTNISWNPRQDIEANGTDWLLKDCNYGLPPVSAVDFGIPQDNNYHFFQVCRGTSANYGSIDGTWTSNRNNFYPFPLSVGIRAEGSSETVNIDWCALRLYVNPEPSVSLWGVESPNVSLTVYAYTNKPYYAPGDTGTLQFWVYDSGPSNLILNNVTIYYPWYNPLALWGGNATIVPSTSTVIAPGGNWSCTASFTVPNDGRAPSGTSSINIIVATNEVTCSSAVPLTVTSVPSYFSLQNMDQLLTLLMILVAAIVICTLIIVAAMFLSMRRQMMPKA
jgi:hypothetical protein